MQKVVEPLRDQLDAVVVFPSMPEVMRLNKVGSFTMQNLGQSKSVVSDFMKKKKKVRYTGRCVMGGKGPLGNRCLDTAIRLGPSGHEFESLCAVLGLFRCPRVKFHFSLYPPRLAQVFFLTAFFRRHPT